MNAIFACKLYKTSPRQAKIQAALADPINTELVLQLAEYIEEDSAVFAEPEESEQATTESVQETEPSVSDEVTEPTDEKDVEDTEDHSETDEELAESSESVSSTSVVNTFDLSEAAAVKDMLNSDVNTLGVSRVAIKCGEFWAYYDDSVNLNSIMSAVIEKVDSLTNVGLEFNRLARSANAVVFQLPDAGQAIE